MLGLLCVGGLRSKLFCSLANIATMASLISYSVGRGPTRRGPLGVICVVASSRATRVVDYCSAHCVRAPGLSHVTTSNMHFARDFITGSLDNPDHTYVVAKGRDYTGGFCSGAAYMFSDSRRAFPGLLREVNCRATLING